MDHSYNIRNMMVIKERRDMLQATRLGSLGEAVTFNYTGNVIEGVVINYDYADVPVGANFSNLISQLLEENN